MIILFRWSLALFSVIWALVILPAEALRIHYVGLRGDVSAGKRVALVDLNGAIAAYETVVSIGGCMPGVREQLASFLSIRSGTHAGPDSLLQIAADLNQADKVLRSMLTCSPYDSNQWLSLAMLDVKRNGVRDKAFVYLNLSYLTGPREAWILERRLTFAAAVAPLVSDDLKLQIRGDIHELRRMRRVTKRFLKRLNLKSLDEFERLFG